MQQIDLVMTKSYAALFGAGTEEYTKKSVEGAPEQWQSLVTESQGQSRVSLILGPPYISFISLELPPIKKQKLRHVIRFELENNLLAPVEDYLWDYSSYLDPNINRTIVLVYFLEKNALQQIEAECKEKGWEIEQVLAWQNLLDLEARRNQTTINGITLLFDQSTVYFLIYVQGHLRDLSWLQLGNNWFENVSRLNAQLKAMYLQSTEEPPLTLSKNIQDLLCVTEKGELRILEDAKTFQYEVSPLTTVTPFRKGQIFQPQGIVSLMKKKSGNFLQWKEQILRFKKVAVLLAVVVGLFTLGGGYQFWLDQSQIQDLVLQRDQIAKRYIPNVAGKKALKQMERTLKKGATSTARVATFQKGPFPTMVLLGQLSDLQRKADSLRVARFNFTDRTYNLQADVKTIAELEGIKEQFKKWYPLSHFALRFQQKTEPNGETRFVVSIEKKRGKS